ncbi:hypothetical protein BKA69DRAFT_662361 [Paraphysoderma sedebokerense]|nr:hypothetical protein BKA69DRAFT_661938 [Paraphysoderma sedebokerense]KAI9145110.1 hypothetical protein BKA69DRAFT_662361 [Paraphysoderma sedebokerense]
MLFGNWSITEMMDLAARRPSEDSLLSCSDSESISDHSLTSNPNLNKPVDENKLSPVTIDQLPAFHSPNSLSLEHRHRNGSAESDVTAVDEPVSPPPSKSSSILKLSTYFSSETVSKKGRCWACWLYNDTASNPLIRACLGCRDVDLQYIHRECIEKYLNSLPPRTDKSYYCTRCKDTYDVSWTELHPMYILFDQNPILAGVIIGMTVSTVILCYSCMILLSRQGSKYVQTLLLFGLKMDLQYWCYFMMGSYTMMNFLVWSFVLKHCSGYVALRVGNKIPVHREKPAKMENSCIQRSSSTDSTMTSTNE